MTINCNIADASGVASAALYYRATGGGAFTSAAMVNSVDETWTGEIPGAAVTTAGVDYYLEAVDSAASPNTGTEPVEGAGAPHQVTINYPDETPPEVAVDALSSPQTAGEDLPVTVTATDDSGVAAVAIYYRTQGDTAYKSIAAGGDEPNFSATIPGADVAEPAIEIYAEAVDGATSANTGVSSVVVARPFELQPGASRIKRAKSIRL